MFPHVQGLSIIPLSLSQFRNTLFPSSGATPTTALPWPTRPTIVLFPIGSTWHLMGSLSSWSDRVFSSASLLSSIIRALASSPALLPFTQSLQEKRSLFGEISNFKQHRRRTCFQDALSPLDRMVFKTPIVDATKTENDNKYPRYGYDLDYCPEWYLQAWESGELISGPGWLMQLFGQVPTQCRTPWRKSTSMQTKMLPLSARRGIENHKLKEQCSLNNSKVPTMLASN